MLPDRGRVRASRPGRRAGDDVVRGARGARSRGLPVAEPARRRGRRQRRRGARRRVRLPRRRLAAAPALGAEGQRALRRDGRTPTAAARCSRRRARARRCCAIRWSTRAAARTRSASGSSPGLAVFPYHGTAADHLRERSIDLLAGRRGARRRRRAHRARPRPATGAWERDGPGPARPCTARAPQPKTARQRRSPASSSARGRDHDSVIVTLSIVGLAASARPSRVGRAALRSSSRRPCPTSPCRSAA